jgi:pSer/pThr/pTyr-binding forkhead associated (FHA) protein
MNIRLVVEKSEGTATPQSIALSSEETVVGRHRDCTLRIPSAEVSRRHCILRIHEGELHIQDLDSLNGSYVNGERVQGNQVLHPGDRLEIGPVIFSVVDDSALVAVATIPTAAEIAASEAGTVDIKPCDTGILQPPAAAEPEVVTVEPVTESVAKVRPEAHTQLDHA